MTGAQFIARTLQGYGVSHVFYVEAVLRPALVEMEELGIRRVSCHAEKAAAYMADGFARAGKRPAVTMCQSVGAANMAAGLKDAFLGGSPVIALTGRHGPMFQHRNAYQEIFHQAMFDPVTKFNARADTLRQFAFLLRQAFREVVTGSPRPAHIDLIGHLGQGTAGEEADLDIIVEEQYKNFPAHRPAPEPEAIARAAGLIAAAKRPIIVAGGGATASGAGPELIALAEKGAIPVATSLNGKALLPGDHRLNVGVVGSYSAWCANKAVDRADLVMFVGSRTGDQVTNSWTVPGPNRQVVQIDLDPAELGRNYPNAAGLCGDAKVALAQLTEAIKPNQDRTWADEAGRLVTAWWAEHEANLTSGAEPIKVERLCAELTEHLPDQACLVVDTGWSGIWTGALVRLNKPGQMFLRAAGSLGWAFPAAMGAKCALPSKPVVCFTGDGGFYYHMAELETAARCGINTVTVINNNSMFGQSRAGTEAANAGRTGNWRELIKFRSVDFSRIAQEMGCLGLRVERPADFAPALEEALAADRPVVVEVITDQHSKAPAAWAPSVRI